MKSEEIFAAYQECIMPTYTKLPLILVKGKGSYLWDIQAKKYLDFFPGWGVGTLGHCHPKVMSALRDQVAKLIFIANNFYHPAQARLAKQLNYWGFKSKVFFCNSGAEANEAAIKFSRKFGKGRYEIITFTNSFHGRTLAALTATGQPKYQEGFAPLVEGFVTVPFNKLESVEKAVSEKTVAIMLELIQGEGGINIASRDFILGLRRICDEKSLLLIIDEVQTGMGRTGKMFCYQHYGVSPDILTLAKALAGGLPMGAMLVKEEIADILGPGTHASTFGGGPLVCKAALAVLEAIHKEKLLTNALCMGEYLMQRLNEIKNKYQMVKEVRGIGLMIGVELEKPGKPVVEACLKDGLLINCTQENVLRLMPALNVNQSQINKAIRILNQALKNYA